MEAVMERPLVANSKRMDVRALEPSIKDRVLEAAKLYLERRGYDVKQRWESDSQLGYVAEDESTLAFVHVVSNGLDKQGFPTDLSMTREEFEQMAISWLSKNGHNYEAVQVRFDELVLKVLCKDKALIRHHVNTWGTC